MSPHSRPRALTAAGAALVLGAAAVAFAGCGSDDSASQAASASRSAAGEQACPGGRTGWSTRITVVNTTPDDITLAGAIDDCDPWNGAANPTSLTGEVVKAGTQRTFPIKAASGIYAWDFTLGFAPYGQARVGYSDPAGPLYVLKDGQSGSKLRGCPNPTLPLEGGIGGVIAGCFPQKVVIAAS